MFNAAVAQRLSLDDITISFDSVSICLSKGLGAPAGSVLVGPKDWIAQAKRWRKMVGGGMRQVGVLAAACEYALDHNVDRLSDDHAQASWLAEHLLNIDGLRVEGQAARTNMVFLSLTHPSHSTAFQSWCRERGLLFGGRTSFRLVIHKDIHESQVVRTADLIRDYFSS